MSLKYTAPLGQPFKRPNDGRRWHPELYPPRPHEWLIARGLFSDPRTRGMVRHEPALQRAGEVKARVEHSQYKACPRCGSADQYQVNRYCDSCGRPF
jgi:hypothetical protein